MPAASLKVIRKSPGREVVIDNLQHSQRITGSLQVTPGTGYEVGGIPLDQAILKLSGVQTNSGIRECTLWSALGTGYIYQRVPPGNMMVLQVPPAGSLTTAAPLQQLGSAAGSLSEVAADIINFEAWVNRNA
jgi:hypothetical protein